MKIDGVNVDDSMRLRIMLREEKEGDRSPPPEEVIPEDVEKLLAADLILRMRRAQQLAPRWSEHSRALYAKQFESLSLQLCAAAAYLKRHRIDDEVPEWLRDGA